MKEPLTYMANERGYIPTNPAAAKQHAKDLGSEVTLTRAKPRGLQFHKRFFALINVFFQQQDHFQSIEAFRRYLIINAGWYSTTVWPNGHTEFFADSIAFSKMDQEEFDKMKNEIAKVIIKEILTPSHEQWVWEEIARF